VEEWRGPDADEGGRGYAAKWNVLPSRSKVPLAAYASTASTGNVYASTHQIELSAFPPPPPGGEPQRLFQASTKVLGFSRLTTSTNLTSLSGGNT